MLVQFLWMAYQTAIVAAVYSWLVKANPDLTYKSAPAVIACFAAFIATAIPFAAVDLFFRLRRRFFPANKGADNPIKVRRR